MATKWSGADIKSFVTANATNGAAIERGMKDYGVGFDDIKAAGGWNDSDLDTWMGAYGTPTLASSWRGAKARTAQAGRSAGMTAETPDSGSAPSSGPATGGLGRVAPADKAAKTVVATPATPGTGGTATPTTGGTGAGPGGTGTGTAAAGNDAKWMSLLEAALNKSTPAAAPAATKTPTRPSSSSAKPQQVKWNEDMSAAGRLQKMLAEDGPLMAYARSQGLLNANSRGVLNSSESAKASQQATMAAASPIAMSDAQSYMSSQIANMNSGNQFTTSGLDRDLGYAKLDQDASQFGQTLGLNYAQLAEQARQANLGASTQMSIAGMNYDIQDRRLNQDDRQFLMNYGLEKQKISNQMEQFAQQFGLSVQELDLKKNQLSQQDRQFYDELKLNQAKLDQQAQQFNKDWENKFSLEGMAQANRIDLATLDANNKKDLMQIEADYKTTIAGNENVSNAWGLVMQEIGKIQNNPELDAASKKTLINNVIGGFKNFTNFWQKVSGGTVDVSALLSLSVDMDDLVKTEEDENSVETATDADNELQGSGA